MKCRNPFFVQIEQLQSVTPVSGPVTWKRTLPQ